MRYFLRSAIVSVALASPLLMPATASASVSIDITVGTPPPPLPVYEQPPIPGDGYIWTPGYWAWDGDDYYWVPGTWVIAPTPGYLWTPAWWGWDGGFYRWHAGYWGPHVGFYGGINYGYGYGGRGYEGGRWQGNQFFYNRSVNNVNVTNIHNTYNTTVVNNVTVNRVSFNGGNGGVNARPTAQEQAFSRDRHIEPTHEQQSHQQAARSNPAMLLKTNGGRPEVGAVQRPGFDRGPDHSGGNDRGAETQRGGNPATPNATPGAGAGRLPSSNYAPHANGNNGGPGAPHGGSNPGQQQRQNQPQFQRPDAGPNNGGRFNAQSQQTPHGPGSASPNANPRSGQPAMPQQNRQPMQQRPAMQPMQRQPQQARPQPQLQQPRPMPQQQPHPQMQPPRPAPSPHEGAGHEGGHHEGH